ncbi:restriction endonuclease subunit S [uncultured Methanobrevibacter sp.]|uniref:restriction endonuclease subunit S n=1 Tax=uncultured Methanobrevibacter sp. TaxID=253161 RepID=UPI0025D66E66|nr:restriction endonuclease subunit S [uncultured Methanobrevibacter sp.]
MHIKDGNMEVFDLNTKYLNHEDLNFMASHYKQDVLFANQTLDKLNDKGLEIKSISDFQQNISVPGRLKLIETTNKVGNPYLSPKDTFLFPISPKKFVIGYPDDLNVEEKQLLITCSGSTGRTVLVNKILKNYVISNDMIRLDINEDKVGYVFAYLNTNIAQILIHSKEYGSTIKHINAEHISDLPIPHYADAFEKQINDSILEAHKIRESAHLLLNEAINELYSLIDMPIVDDEDIVEEELIGEYEDNRCFILNSKELNARFDGSFHNPVSRENYKNIKNKGQDDKFNIFNLEDLADIFVPPRFKRVYTTDKSNSVPFLQGSHIIQIKPQGIRRLYDKIKIIDDLIVKEGMILLTGSGTVGKVSLVSENWNNWAASNHIIRLVIQDQKINQGYLLLFLLSDYAQLQIDHLVYGSNVDEIGEAGELIHNIKILVPKDKEIENKIGNKVIEAYSLRDKANVIENETISRLQSLMLL